MSTEMAILVLSRPEFGQCWYHGSLLSLVPSSFSLLILMVSELGTIKLLVRGTNDLVLHSLMS